MNKENIEPKNQIESNDYWALSKEKQELYQQVTLQREPWGWVDRFRFGGPGMDELKTVYRLKKHLSSLAQPPAISSNEGETVEATNVQEGKFEALLRRHGIFEYDVRMNAVIDDLYKQWQAGQSRHIYTEDKWISVEDRLPEVDLDNGQTTFSKIVEIVSKNKGRIYAFHEHRYNSDGAKYWCEQDDISSPIYDVTQWRYCTYSEAEVLAIIEQVRNQCAEFSAIGETFTQIVEKDFKQLLK